MTTVRIGIIGIGGMGSGHANYLIKGEVKNAVLTAVCDIRPERLEWAQKELGDKVARFSDYNELLDSGLVDMVMIATPHYLHPVIGIAAFEKGINVLSEKPIGVYTKAVEELMAAAKKSGKLFGIMYNQRTNPMFQKVRKLVKDGELGDLKRVIYIITNWYRSQSYYDSGTWRATWSGEGGGVLINQCPHNLDLWQWICGMPVKVRAFCKFGKYHNIEVEDDVTAYVEYENGATGVLMTTTGEAPGTNRLEIAGTKGKIVCEDNKATFYRLSQDEREFNATHTGGFGAPGCDVIEEYVFQNGGPAHKGITQNFVDALLTGSPLLAPGEEGILGLTISNAIHLSSWTDDWVTLPIDKELYLQELNKRIAESKVKKEASGAVMDVNGTFNQ